MKQIGIQEALQHVADHPEDVIDSPIDAPIWKLVGQTLFVIANTGSSKRRGSLQRATRAQKFIFNRLVGTRRPGSNLSCVSRIRSMA